MPSKSGYAERRKKKCVRGLNEGPQLGAQQIVHLIETRVAGPPVKAAFQELLRLEEDDLKASGIVYASPTKEEKPKEPLARFCSSVCTSRCDFLPLRV